MVLLCGDGSIGPLNLQRIINSGGGEGAGPMGFCLHVHVRPFAVRANTCSSTGSVGRGACVNSLGTCTCSLLAALKL